MKITYSYEKVPDLYLKVLNNLQQFPAGFCDNPKKELKEKYIKHSSKDQPEPQNHQNTEWKRLIPSSGRVARQAVENTSFTCHTSLSKLIRFFKMLLVVKTSVRISSWIDVGDASSEHSVAPVSRSLLKKSSSMEKDAPPENNILWKRF